MMSRNSAASLAVRPNLRRPNAASQARCASSNTMTCSCGGSERSMLSRRNPMSGCMALSVFCRAMRRLPPCSCASRASASRMTWTSGRLPVRNAAPLVARNTAFKPHSVLPAPGMPVTNSTSCRNSARAVSTAWRIASVVRPRLPTSARASAISATPCRLYSMVAASTIVGTGRYGAASQARASNACTVAGTRATMSRSSDPNVAADAANTGVTPCQSSGHSGGGACASVATRIGTTGWARLPAWKSKRSSA